MADTQPSKRQMGHGDAKRMYDFTEQLGMGPCPWQLEFLEKLEQRSMDEQFVAIIRGASDV